MHIRAVIFDRDGVLAKIDVDKAKAHYESFLPVSIRDISEFWDAFGEMHGFPKTVAAEKIFWENFWHSFCKHFHLSESIQEKLFQVHYTEFMQAYPEARKVLLEVRKLNLKVGVLSNFTLASLELSLSAMHLMDLIDIAYTAISLGVSKPHPKAYLAVINALKVTPQECLFFDDEIENVEGAKAIGMHAYLVKRDELHHDISHCIVRDLTSVPIILKKINNLHSDYFA